MHAPNYCFKFQIMPQSLLLWTHIRHEALIEQAASPNFEQKKHPDLESCPKGTTLIQHFKKHAHEKHVSQMIN